MPDLATSWFDIDEGETYEELLTYVQGRLSSPRARCVRYPKHLPKEDRVRIPSRSDHRRSTALITTLRFDIAPPPNPEYPDDFVTKMRECFDEMASAVCRAVTDEIVNGRRYVWARWNMAALVYRYAIVKDDGDDSFGRSVVDMLASAGSRRTHRAREDVLQNFSFDDSDSKLNQKDNDYMLRLGRIVDEALRSLRVAPSRSPARTPRSRVSLPRSRSSPRNRKASAIGRHLDVGTARSPKRSARHMR